jgi:ribosome-associated heat shock protein Hsp15
MSERPASDRGMRLDKWLWVARFFKTRALAVEAIDGARVKVDGDRVKRAKLVQVGDEVRIRQGPYEHIVQVRALSERRGPAKEAAKLYEETPASIVARERVALQLKMAHALFMPDTTERPTKRDRRRLDEFRKKGGWGE